MHLKKEYLYGVIQLAAFFLIIKGETCTYKELENTKGNQLHWSGYKVVANIKKCEEFCTETPGCLASEFDLATSGCYLYNTVTELSSKDGVFFLNKTCAPDETTTEATTEATTTETTTEETETPTSITTTSTITSMTTQSTTESGDSFVGCSMSRSLASPVSGSAFLTLSTNAASCKTACLYINECAATTFINNTCNMFSQTTSTVIHSESVDYIKSNCSNGKPCCMVQTSTQIGTPSRPLLSIKASVQDCEEVCRLVNECTAINYHQTEQRCYLYTKNPTIVSSGSSIHSIKACQPSKGETEGQLHFNGNCQASTTTKKRWFRLPLVRKPLSQCLSYDQKYVYFCQYQYYSFPGFLSRLFWRSFMMAQMLEDLM